MFVDGENVTIRGQRFASAARFSLIAGKYWQKNVYLWLPNLLGRQTSFISSQVGVDVSPTAVRAHYYTSVVGDETLIEQTRRALWDLEFQPEVFKRPKPDAQKPDERKSKGVDITLARDMLSHAHQGHYDIAVLVGGDGDYATRRRRQAGGEDGRGVLFRRIWCAAKARARATLGLQRAGVVGGVRLSSTVSPCVRKA